MLLQQAKVLHYQNGTATIQSFALSGCGGCAANTGCTTRSLSALAGEKQALQFQLAVSQPLQAGDIIEIGVTEQHLLAGVFWLYGLPLCALLTGTVVFSNWVKNELGLLLSIVVATFSTFLWVKKQMKKKHQAAFTPVFVRKL